jgi:Domain of unknown function (DUF4349)
MIGLNLKLTPSPPYPGNQAMKSSLLFAALLFLILGNVGCNKKGEANYDSMAKAPASREDTILAILGEQPQNNNPEGAKPAEVKQEKAPAAPAVSRKIKYAAVIQLIAEDFAKAEAAVGKLVQDAQGYVANSEVKMSPGAIRMGYWKVRIPVKEFDSFRTAILKLGEVDKNATDSQDLTEDYYDLENNIKNRQAEEEALRKIMEKASDRMENFFAVRRELNQVREDIDHKLGRLKLLANLTDMTTVTLTIREKQKYADDKGPNLAENPSFPMRVSRTFSESAGGLISLFQTLAIVLVALAPWSPLILAVGFPTFIYLRRWRKVATPILAKNGDNG